MTLMRMVLAWVLMTPLAIGNGVFRNAVLLPRMGELRAHQLSTLILLLLFAAYIAGYTALWPPADVRQAWLTGLLWLGLTLLFEFGFGHFVAGHPWSRLFHDYNVAAGRVWVLVPLWTALAPWVFFRLRDSV